MPAPAEFHLLTAARQWHDAGYCVIPSHEDGGKRPFGAWKQYQAQRPDWETVEGWLSSGRYTGIGVLTGATSGNVEMHELEGPLEAAVERLGRVVARASEFADIGLPDLLRSIAAGCVEQSAGGGLHLFIRVSDGPALGNTKLARTAEGKVVSETRGEGGFVVVAPTPGRNGHEPGASYIFINGGHPSRTVEVTSEERDLLHLLFTMALDEYAEPEHVPTTPSAPQVGLSAFDDYRQRVTWRDILAPAGWREGHTDGDGRTHWTRPGGVKFEGTSATTLEDGPMYVFSTSVDMPQEKGLSKGQVYAYLHHHGDLSAAARDLTARGYGEPGERHEIPAWEAVLDPDASPDEKAEAAQSWVAEHLPRLDWHELWKADHKEEWIVQPLLAARRLVALYSAPKVGKSLLMLEIAAAIANGRGMFGYEPPARPYRTLYVDFENDPQADIRERLQNMGYGPDDLDNLVMLSFPTIAKFDTERGAQELMAAVDYYGAEIVVIDTVSRAVQGEENENDTWLNFYKHTGLRLKQAGVALIRLDHAGKDETKGQRGGSAKSGDVDAVWRMSKDGDDKFDLVCEAQRFPISETRLTIRRVDDTDGLRHEVVSNPARDREQVLLEALAEHNIDRELSRTAASKALRAAGHQFKERIPERVWERYQTMPRTFTVVQDGL
jgi:hypothetical protein